MPLHTTVHRGLLFAGFRREQESGLQSGERNGLVDRRHAACRSMRTLPGDHGASGGYPTISQSPWPRLPANSTRFVVLNVSLPVQ